MKQYSFLANVYDILNSDYDYNRYADFLDSEIKANEKTRSSLVLDLACGTGKITFALHERGYDMTGIDLSEEMLTIAKDICYDKYINDILWLCQDMTSFELYGTVDEYYDKHYIYRTCGNVFSRALPRLFRVCHRWQRTRYP